jgi:hypothetical protein
MIGSVVREHKVLSRHQMIHSWDDDMRPLEGTMDLKDREAAKAAEHKREKDDHGWI